MRKKSKLVLLLMIMVLSLAIVLVACDNGNTPPAVTVTTVIDGEETEISVTDNALELVSPSKTGYTFVGWFTDAELTTEFDKDAFLIDTNRTNIKVYAKWTANEYTITFNSNGGSAVANITGSYNSDVVAPTAPTKDGYTFAGWYADKGLTKVYTFSKVTQNETLYAKWSVNQYTITFNSNGGSTVLSIVANYNSTITEPQAPTKTGYTFAGWYTDSALTKAYTFGKVTQNETLYAKWTANKYNVTFMDGDVQFGDVVQVTYNENYGKLPVPPTSDKKFLGWYTDTVGGEQILDDQNYPIASDITLYARWEDKSDLRFIVEDILLIGTEPDRKTVIYGTINEGVIKKGEIYKLYLATGPVEVIVDGIEASKTQYESATTETNGGKVGLSIKYANGNPIANPKGIITKGDVLTEQSCSVELITTFVGTLVSQKDKPIFPNTKPFMYIYGKDTKSTITFTNEVIKPNERCENVNVVLDNARFVELGDKIIVRDGGKTIGELVVTQIGDKSTVLKVGDTFVNGDFEYKCVETGKLNVNRYLGKLDGFLTLPIADGKTTIDYLGYIYTLVGYEQNLIPYDAQIKGVIVLNNGDIIDLSGVVDDKITLYIDIESTGTPLEEVELIHIALGEFTNAYIQRSEAEQKGFWHLVDGQAVMW